MPTTYWARTDSSSANNPAVNLRGDPATEITFVPSGGSGDILLEYNGGSFDPDTQVLINGVAYNFTFELSADMPTTKNNGAQQVPDQFEGSTTYLITVSGYPAPGQTTRLIFLPEEEATQQEMDAFGNGAIALQNIDTTTTGVICFASGTLMRTPEGECPVEDLVAGDLVVTLDAGPQPIVWASATELCWPGHSEDELPIVIKADAFGSGQPSRDLIVSPQHKILVPFGETGADAVLAPVKGLIALRGVRQMRGKRWVTYHHLMLARHHVLWSEGVASESFYPGPTAMKMLKPDQRSELLSLFPTISQGVDEGYGPRARRALSVGEAREFAAAVKLGMSDAVA